MWPLKEQPLWLQSLWHSVLARRDKFTQGLFVMFSFNGCVQHQLTFAKKYLTSNFYLMLQPVSELAVRSYPFFSITSWSFCSGLIEILRVWILFENVEFVTFKFQIEGGKVHRERRC